MLAGYVVFLVVYFAGYTVRGPRILWLMAVMNLLAVGFSSRNPGAATFLIYAAAMVGNGFGRPGAPRCVLAGQVACSAPPLPPCSACRRGTA